MSNQRFTLLLKSQWTYIVLFGILGLLGSINHSMWRDEMNVWLIAKYSHNLADFLDNIRYDRGHPGLWHILVSIVFHIADYPIMMRLLHWIIGLLGVVLLWLFSPFTQKQKILFSFGYLPFYENLLISRNYGLGMLFLFGICAAFPTRNKTYFGLACLLLLLANSNIYGLLIASALALTLLLELVVYPDQKKLFFRQSSTWLRLSPWLDIVLSGTVILLGFIAAAYMIFPPATVATKQVLTEITTESNFERFLVSWGRILGGYTLLIPSQDRLLDLAVCGVIAIVMFSIFLTIFLRKPIPLFFFSFSSLQLFLMSYISFPGRGPRHFGHFYLILIAALWLSRYYQSQNWWLDRVALFRIKRLKKIQLFTLMFILYIQFFGGLLGFANDILVPFSASSATARFIKENKLQNEFIVASRNVNMAAISGYLGRELYYPETGKLGSFSLVLKDKSEGLSKEQVLPKVQELLARNSKLKRVLLILHKELETFDSQLQIVPIRKFERSVHESERYYLYWVSLSTIVDLPK